jgi:uncharacterized protein YdeI (YjbR/CyaY-like superfamily)
MTKSKKNPKVDLVLSKAKKWQKELQKLRTILLGCGLTEELKWGKPCYTFQETNLMMIYGLKESCAIAFFNGALLKDDQGILIKPGPNSQAARWIKFTSLGEIDRMAGRDHRKNRISCHQSAYLRNSQECDPPS